MVVTSAPSICQTKTVQALTALPLTCTTQAPHCDVSQPTCVPVSRRCSRRNCTSRVRGSTSPVTALPFTVNAAADMASSSKSDQKASFFAPTGGPTADRVKIGPILPRGVVWNKSTLNPPCAAGQGYWRLRKPPTAQPSARLHYRLREFGEEIVGCLLGRTVDQALPELGELAADLRLHVIGKERAAVLVGERHFGAALGEACDTALAFARDAVAVGRIEIGEPHLALPARLDRTDLDGGDGLELVVGNLVELLAAGNAALEHLRVVELGPYHLAAGGELDLPTHGHGHRRSPSFRAPI